MSLNEIQATLNIALGLLYKNDAFLLEHAIHERSITHKLAEYLQQEFRYHNVDCEYNRQGINPKILDRHCDGEDKHRVYPDIVVHLRGNDTNNLLVIEAKPVASATVPECDQIKLVEFTKLSGQYRYKFGIFIGFDKLNDPQLEWFVNGDRVIV